MRGALNEGFHVVTPNKKANTRDMAYYNLLRENARKNQRKFLYDTNVGAGLPVIENLQNLLAAGDEVNCFQGIYLVLYLLFWKIRRRINFFTSYRTCSRKGFTEPDPRDDLSGKDVARKLLILAREMSSLELDDVEIGVSFTRKFFRR